MAGAAISMGVNPFGTYMRIDFYKYNWNTRTLLQTFNVPLNDALVGINNTTTDIDRVQTVVLSNINLSLVQGDAFGVVFVPQGGDFSRINAVINLFGTLHFLFT